MSYTDAIFDFIFSGLTDNVSLCEQSMGTG